VPQLGALAGHSYQVDMEARSLLCLRGLADPERAGALS